MSKTELPPIGLKPQTTRHSIDGEYSRARMGLYSLIELSTREVSQGRAQSIRRPVTRSFILEGGGTKPSDIQYRHLEDSDILEQQGLTPDSSQYVLCNGVYIEAGKITPEGTMSAKFNKSDGTLLDSDRLNQELFPGRAKALAIPVDAVRLTEDLFSNLRNLGTPKTDDFAKVLGIVDAALPTVVPTSQREMRLGL